MGKRFAVILFDFKFKEIQVGFNRILIVSRTSVTRMPLESIRCHLSTVCRAINVSTLNDLSGFSTQFGNSTRSYIRNFWAKGTALPHPGHRQHGKRLDGYNKNLYVSFV